MNKYSVIFWDENDNVQNEIVVARSRPDALRRFNKKHEYRFDVYLVSKTHANAGR